MDEPIDLRPRDPRWRWLAVDAIVVLLFVLIGRDTHNEGNAVLAVVGTAAPFVAGLIGGWIATDAVREPLSVRTGVGVALMTAVAGLAIRRLVFGDGIAPPFVFVALGFLLATLVGWRLAAARIVAQTERV